MLFLPWNPVMFQGSDHDLVMIRQILLHGEKWKERFDPKKYHANILVQKWRYPLVN